MTALGGLLVVVGFQHIRPQQVVLVWQTGLVARAAMILTLQAKGGQLILAGISSSLREQLDRTGTTALIGEDNLFMFQEQVGAPMNEALW
jgi:hypothetical protein